MCYSTSKRIPNQKKKSFHHTQETNSVVIIKLYFITSAQVIGFGTSLGVVMVRVIMSREIPAENQGE